jgi:hypothetical protein
MDIYYAKSVIKAAMMAGDTVIQEGKHGIGKSQVVNQFAKEENLFKVDLFLSNQDIGDLIGIPDTIMIDGEKVTTWSVPIWLQRMRMAAALGQVCILHLDELNRAPVDIRNGAMQLILEGKIHEHELPIVNLQKTMIVASINPADDYQVDELDPAMLDRFLFISVEAVAETWLIHAREVDVNSVVRDFISEYPDRLHWTPADGGIGSTPRSWTKLGKYMDNVDQIPEEILFQIMKGKVGTEIASQFYAFYEHYIDVIKVEDIEKVVNDNVDTVQDIEELGGLIHDLMHKTEAIQKSDLAIQLANKYMPKDDIMVFLAYLYSLDIEICVAFLKGYKKDDNVLYRKLAEIDTKLNNKLLFKRIVQAADRK